MAPGRVLGLSLIVGVCLASVVAQRYWVGETEPEAVEPYADYQDGSWSVEGDYAEGRPVAEATDRAESDEDHLVYVPEGAYPIPGPLVNYDLSEEQLGRDGWGGGKKKKKKKGKKKKKKKKKCKKKKKKGKKKGKGCEKKGGWGPVTVSTDGVKVGWKGFIPPVKGAGWGWFGEKSGHFSFSDHGGWKKEKPFFPEPGPPKFIKHGPVHHKVIHKVKGWGWGGH